MTVFKENKKATTTTDKSNLDKQYPSFTETSTELMGFVDYIQALGYSINEIESTNTLELIKGTQTTVLVVDDFKGLQNNIKSMLNDTLEVYKTDDNHFITD